jgi:hypothetical protein
MLMEAFDAQLTIYENVGRVHHGRPDDGLQRLSLDVMFRLGGGTRSDY